MTQKWVNAYIARPRATVLIDSDNDTIQGENIARYIYSHLTQNSQTPLILVDAVDKKSIGIEDIRSLQKSLQLKANADGEYTRFIMIPDAHTLTPEAQNSLLKLMEELPDKTILMIVVASKDAVLQTVLSRCFVIPVLPITKQQSIEYAESRGIAKAVYARAFLLSEGRVSIFLDLLKDDNTEIMSLVDMAKKFITDSVFDRQELLQLLGSKKSTINYNEFIGALKLTARSGMRYATTRSSKKHWQHILKQVLLAEDQLQRNVQQKLVMLSLSVSI